MRADRNQPAVQELQFRNDQAFLSLIVNRRTGTIRVIDFRSGSVPVKRVFVQSVAQREGATKAFTLVEKDEVSSWVRLGFWREGQIPGFYKRSDAYMLGCVIAPESNGEDAVVERSSPSDGRLAERTIHGAKKILKDIPEVVTGCKLRGVDAADVASTRDEVVAKGLAINTFDPFGRHALRLYLEAIAGSGEVNYLSAEFEECFGHSTIEVLKSPTDLPQVLSVTAGIRAFSDELKRRGIVSAFGFTPSDDGKLAACFIASGYRKTGLLAKHGVVKGERVDMILWTRKLANPAGDGEPMDDEDI
ncbi:MAG: hypothetical protein IT379_21560 [Deltaproteobacteria bacterium]|nr:hypothetical protein [Deltaproteobacteria bacterium]